MSENNNDGVGYRRPPKHSQFRPGQSGNPLGRRHGINNFQTDLVEVLSEEVTIREHGVDRKLTKQKAIVDALVTAAVRGDMRATTTLMSFCLRPASTSGDVAHKTPATEDAEILKTLQTRKRKRRSTQKGETTSNNQTQQDNENE